MVDRKTAVVIWKGDGLNFQGQLGSGYQFDMSGQASATNGGSAMEFLLVGVAGCTAIDVVHILRKMRQPFSHLRVEISGTRAADHPMVYTDVEIVYIISGHDVDPEAVARAITLSQETYCSASIMFKRAGTNVTTSFRIEPA